MRFLIQRVKRASVSVDDKIIGEIDRGFLVLIGISGDDDERIADKLISKMCGLRIFDDASGKTNLSLSDVGGSVLLVSQFTLYANCKHGNRPSFTNAGAPDMAEKLYSYIISKTKERLGDDKVACGSFGAEMNVELLNHGPFTVMLDSNELIKNNI